jgi:phosphatidylglycerophosphatase A
MMGNLSKNFVGLEKLISEKFSTLGGLGKIKYGPGTIGSVFGTVMAFFTPYVSNFIASHLDFDFTSENVLINGFLILFLPFLLIAISLYITGTHYSDVYEKNSGNKDPSEVIIDELLGAYIVHFCCWPISLLGESTIIHNSLISLGFSYVSAVNIVFTVFWLILPLVLFRLLDIYKPWPIYWFDQELKGGKSIMLDDVVAAVMAIVLNYIIFFILEDLARYIA